MKSLSARASAELSAYDAIFITGGSSGIGEAFLRDALSCGSSRVFNISRTPPAQSLQSLRKFSHITCDLTDEASILSLFGRLKLEFESLDKFCLDNFARPPRVLLVNNAADCKEGKGFDNKHIERGGVRALPCACGLCGDESVCKKFLAIAFLRIGEIRLQMPVCLPGAHFEQFLQNGGL